MLKRLIGWITGRTERLRGIERRAIQRSDSMLIMDEFRKLQDLINLQSRLDGKRHTDLSARQFIIEKSVLELVHRAEEDAFEPFVYDISASDLFMLNEAGRDIVRKSKVNCFNDIIPIHLVRVKGCGEAAIDCIMQWKRECVSRITQEQVTEALDAKEGNGTGGRMNLHTKAGRELHGDK